MYQTKRNYVEAYKIEEQLKEAPKWVLNGLVSGILSPTPGHPGRISLHDDIHLSPGDWLVCDRGLIFSYNEDSFHKVYEPTPKEGQ